MTFYFCHIPKTSGTTLTRLLETNFPVDAIYAPYFQEELWNSDLDMRDKSLVRGHFLSSKQFRFGTDEVRLLTMLRDPVQRYYSQFKHKQRASREQRGRGGAGLLKANVQTYWLAAEMLYPIERETLSTMADEQVFEAAATTLQSAYWVGIVERHLESMLLLMGMNGWRPVNLSIRENIAPERQSLSISSEHAEMVRSLHDLDTKLYELGTLELDRRIALFLAAAESNKHTERDNEIILGELIDKYTAACPTLVSELIKKETMAGQLYRAALFSYFSKAEQLCSPAKEQICLQASDPFCGEGWHRREWAPGVEPYRWSGPGLISDVHLPFNLGGKIALQIHVNAWHDRLSPGLVQIKLNGVPIIMKEQYTREIPGCLLCGEVSLPVGWQLPFAVLEFSVPETRRLCDFTDAPDRRPVGFSFKSIKIASC